MEKHILLAEGHQASLDLLQDVLEDTGFRVLVAQTGPECVDLARAHRPAAVLLGDKLPGADALHICRQLKGDERTSACRVVIMTVMDTPLARTEAQQAGADAWLAKPFSPADILSSALG